jgi:hypothetical protein
MSYKDPAVRVVPANGRYCIESRVGDVWHLVALREHQEAAQSIAGVLIRTLREHSDDRYAAEARDRAAAESEST